MEYEVYFSGVSSSTKTSAINNKCSLQLDSESLEAQLDRLNSTLVGLLNNDEQEYCDSFSFQGLNDSYQSPLPSSCHASETSHSERYQNNPEQLLMICEDYRSHEIRSQEKSLKKVSVECQLSDLYSLHSDLFKSIELIEQGISNSVQLRAGELCVKLQIKKGFFVPNKGKISQGFCEGNLARSEKAYVTQLENEVEELRYNGFHFNRFRDLDELMMKSFNDQFLLNEVRESRAPCMNCKDLATQTKLEIETKLAGKMNSARKGMLEELEWEVSNTKMMKSVYEGKIQELKDTERKIVKQIQEINSEIVKKCKSLENEKVRFAKEQERQKTHEQNLRTNLSQVRTELESIKEKLNKAEPQALTIQIPTPCATPKHDSEPNDLISLELEINSLEQDRKTAADKSSIDFRINKLKTKLSSLRSTKILETCTNKKRMSTFIRPKDLTSTTPKVNTAFNFNIPIESLKFTPRGDNRNLTCFSERPKDLLIEPSPLQTSRNNEELTKEENFFRTLELKEARLRKKEEEIMKQEIKLQQTWMKLPDANQLIPIVRSELDRYMIQNENLKRTQAELDKVLKDQLENWKKNRANEAETMKSQENLMRKLKNAEQIEQVLVKLARILN